MKPISNTAFWCCGVRMRDAERKKPVCGDIYAKEFMDERGLRILEEFKREKGPNAASPARHRIIDDVLRERLAEDPGLCVIIIGAGFDSRAYRLNGGVWIELDEPQVIEYKNARLPAAKCKNKLHRIAIDFATESVEAKLASYATHKSIAVVIEGVFMYLPPDAIKALLATLQRLFPRHTLVCDLMTRRFFEKYSRSLYETIKKMGAVFAYTVDAPADLFTGSGYRIANRTSIIGRAAELGAFPVPGFIVRTFLRTMTNGYQIYTLEFG